jgi:hypothetical protein
MTRLASLSVHEGMRAIVAPIMNINWGGYENTETLSDAGNHSLCRVCESDHERIRKSRPISSEKR